MSSSEALGHARLRFGLAFVVPTFLIGLLGAAQIQTQATRTPFVARYQVPLAEAAAVLGQEQDDLKVQITALRARLDALAQQGTGFDERSAATHRQLEALRARAGLTALAGGGITVTLDDARLPADAPRRSIELGIIHSQDLTDVINAGWRLGAEAISINGERITGTSACVGAVIQLNGSLLSPPFVVSLLGPSDALYAGVTDAQTLTDIKRRQSAFGLGWRVDRASALAIPAYAGPVAIRYAAVR